MTTTTISPEVKEEVLNYLTAKEDKTVTVIEDEIKDSAVNSMIETVVAEEKAEMIKRYKRIKTDEMNAYNPTDEEVIAVFNKKIADIAKNN